MNHEFLTQMNLEFLSNADDLIPKESDFAEDPTWEDFQLLREIRKIIVGLGAQAVVDRRYLDAIAITSLAHNLVDAAFAILVGRELARGDERG